MRTRAVGGCGGGGGARRGWARAAAGAGRPSALRPTSSLTACLPRAGEPGPISDIRRGKAVALAAAEAASRAALLLEAADLLAPGGTAADIAAALGNATKRAGLPPGVLVPLLRAAALPLPTDDASARIAASIRVQELANLLA